MNITTDAVVVRTKNIGNDRCVWLLTENLGVISLYLKGAGSVRSKFASSTQLFTCGEAVLFKNKDKYSLNSFDITDTHFKLQSDLLKLSLASYLCEAMCDVSSMGENTEEYLPLLKNALYLVEKGEKNPALVKAVFEMRLMVLSGFMPDIVNCSECNAVLPEEIFFSIEEGLCLCKKCRKAPDGGFYLPPPVVSSLRHIIFSDRKKIFSFNISLDNLNILARFCEVYFLYHIGRSFKTLEFYQSIL